MSLVNKFVLSIIALFFLFIFLILLSEGILYLRYKHNIPYLSLADSKMPYDCIYKPNLNFYYTGFGIRFKTNNYGIRREKNIEKKTPKDVYRILLYGDSITCGYGVENNYTYSSLLENKMNKMSTKVKYE